MDKGINTVLLFPSSESRVKLMKGIPESYCNSSLSIPYHRCVSRDDLQQRAFSICLSITACIVLCIMINASE